MTHWMPLARTGPLRPEGALTLAGGWTWFDRCVALEPGRREVVAPGDVPPDVLERLVAPRPPVAGLSMDRPRLMGILNVTPDSFSDGGRHAGAAAEGAARLVADGADILDIGGESTRPGAVPVPPEEETARVLPVLRAGVGAPVSIDTRNAATARAALEAGAAIVNDVSALSWDPDMAGMVARSGAPVVLMHARGTPETMQDDPDYGDVTVEVLDALGARIAAAEAAGIARRRILVDPGIGFGKTLAHNLQLLRELAAFHAFGCPLVLGVSRKGTIGTVTGVRAAAERGPGSAAAALTGLARGAQIVRVHDVALHRQAVRAWAAVEAPGLLEER